MIKKLLIKLYGPDWKTSLNGDLQFLMVVGTFVSGYIVITPATPHWLVYIVGALTFIASFCRAIVGRLQFDAPKPKS